MKRTLHALLAIACTALAGCSGAHATPSADGHTSTKPSTAARPSPSATAASPIEGTWRSAKLTEAEVVTWYAAAGGEAEDLKGTRYPSVTAAGRAFFAQLGTGAKRYAVITITFQSGSFAEFESGDGNPPVLGDSQSYTVIDGRILTLTALDPPPCVGTYSFRITGRQLRMHLIKQCANRLAGPFPTTLYASFPYTKVS